MFPATSSSSLSRHARIARRWLGPVFAALAAGVVIQTFLAGLAVFGHARFWAYHMTFVHGFDWLSLPALGLSILGRHSRRVQLLAAAALGLILFLYVSAGLDLATDARYVAATHPVLALLLFWVCATGARSARAEDRAGRSVARGTETSGSA